MGHSHSTHLIGSLIRRNYLTTLVVITIGVIIAGLGKQKTADSKPAAIAQDSENVASVP